MERSTAGGSKRLGQRATRAARATGLLLAASLIACVGSEGGSAGGSARREGEAARATQQQARRPAVRGVDVDTIPVLEYQLFEESLASREPRKAVYRFLLMRAGSTEAVGKTLRLVLDSLARADSGLVGVRAILYEFRPTHVNEGKLLPRAWGEWVPPEGWDSATADSRTRFHRSYIYHVSPLWSQSEPDSGEVSGRR